MTKSKMVLMVGLAVVSMLGLTGLIRARAATTVNLGSADNFAVLAGSTITNTGSSVITGGLGLTPGSAVTGFPPAILNGVQNVANPEAVQAQTDLTAAYDNAAGQIPVSVIPTELGGTTLIPGTYASADGTFGVTGTLTLDAQGDPSAVFIFKTASTLITAGASNIALINGAQACNVFWQVSTSATLGANSTFKGNILALTSATLTTGANVEGRVLARNGAVTLDSNNVTRAICAVAPITAPISEPTPTPVPTSTPIVTPTSTPIVTPTSTPIVTPTSTPIVTPTPVEVIVPTSTPTSTPIIVPTIKPVIPKFPKTGISPNNNSVISWSIVIPVGLLASLASLYVARKKLAL